MDRCGAGALDERGANQVRMPKHALNSRAIGSLCLAATATGWALGWSAMKLLIRDWPPLFSRGVAGIAASLILAVVAVRNGEHRYGCNHLHPLK
jgi:hypothetical protein